MASETDDQFPQGMDASGRSVRSESQLSNLGGTGDAPLRFQRQGTAEAGNVMGNGMVPAGGATILASSMRAMCKVAPSGGDCTIEIEGWGPGYAGSDDDSVFSAGIITIQNGDTEWDPAVDLAPLDATNKVCGDNTALRGRIVLANGAEDVTLILGFTPTP